MSPWQALKLKLQSLPSSDVEGENPTEGVLARPGVRRPKQIAFAALQHRDYRAYFIGTMLSMMADNIEHVISYWVIFQAFKSPVLGGFAVISHWAPFLLFSVYLPFAFCRLLFLFGSWFLPFATVAAW